MLRALVIAASLASATVAPASAPAAQLPGREGALGLGRYVELLEDPGGALALEDVRSPGRAARWMPSEAATPNLGYTRSAWWLRFRLRAAPGPAEELLLEIRFPSIDRLEFYVPQGAGWRQMRAGDMLPWDAREVKHRNHVFRFTLAQPPATQEFYLRVASGGVLTVPAYLWRPEAFERDTRHTQLLLGLFYGLIAALVLYNAMLYFAVRDRAYLYYVAYAAAFGVFLFSFDGLAFQYLWPESVWWANHGLATALALALAFGTLFASRFLDMARTAPLGRRLMQALAAAGGLLALSAASGRVLEYGDILRIVSVLGLGAAATAIVVAVRALLAGFRPATFFLLAWGALLVFIALGALRNYALVPSSALTIYGLHIGFALDVLLLSFALADRINLLKREAGQAQASALAHREALLEATRASGRDLEQKVAERTAELNRTNERLREEVREREQLMHQLKEREEHLRFIAQHDPLTGLPNRTSMQQRLSLAMELAKRNRKKLALMMVDLNDFKRVNDTRGHAVGDHALAAIAGRLRTSVRGSDTVARYGGDEFVVLAGELDRAEDAGAIAEKIADMVAVPLPVDGVTERIGCSIGISLYPDHAESAEQLLELADRAMYAAKGGKDRRYAYFAPA